ncbi:MULTISPECIES: NUDIX domain-containing protein [Sphingobacterium]|uniref:NUDIX domain-containing protein n=1 Tax=Sphingobacterium TaxID=28453 RepID=UPI00257D726E|nr:MULTISPECIES: NUDIX domain-containing protein [Sphingobacterium]
MQHKIIDKVALINIKDRKILSTRSKTKTKFYFPGGKRENNESDITCLKREILEELSVHIPKNQCAFWAPLKQSPMDEIKIRS